MTADDWSFLYFTITWYSAFAAGYRRGTARGRSREEFKQPKERLMAGASVAEDKLPVVRYEFHRHSLLRKLIGREKPEYQNSCVILASLSLQPTIEDISIWMRKKHEALSTSSPVQRSVSSGVSLTRTEEGNGHFYLVTMKNEFYTTAFMMSA